MSVMSINEVYHAITGKDLSVAQYEEISVQSTQNTQVITPSNESLGFSKVTVLPVAPAAGKTIYGLAGCLVKASTLENTPNITERNWNAGAHAGFLKLTPGKAEGTYTTTPLSEEEFNSAVLTTFGPAIDGWDAYALVPPDMSYLIVIDICMEQQNPKDKYLTFTTASDVQFLYIEGGFPFFGSSKVGNTCSLPNNSFITNLGS